MTKELFELLKNWKRSTPDTSPYRQGLEAVEAEIQRQLAQGNLPETAQEFGLTHEPYLIQVFKRARGDSAYISVETLIEEQSRHKGKVSRHKFDYEYAIRDINERGNDSLYHLCISFHVLNILNRHAVNSISELYEYQKKNGLNFRNMGDARVRELTDAMAYFESHRNL